MMTLDNWRTALQNDDMPLTVTADDILDLDSEFVHDAVFRYGNTYIIMVNGWFYRAIEGENSFQRCGPLERLDPVMFS